MLNRNCALLRSNKTPRRRPWCVLFYFQGLLQFFTYIWYCSVTVFPLVGIPIGIVGVFSRSLIEIGFV